MTEIEKIRSADYVENMLAESENQDRRDEKLILVWFLLLALAIFANRFTDGDFPYVLEGLGIIGFVGYFLTK